MEVTQTHRDWLKLSLSKGIGPVLFHRLYTEFGSVEAILSTDLSQLESAGFSKKLFSAIHEKASAEYNRVLDWLEKPGNKLITLQDPSYPPLLKQTDAPPPILFAVGQIDTLLEVNFAIVGSRNPTSGGRKHAEEFAYALAESGFCICSGLALGIDYHSHIGALNAGANTIAVLGNGLDRVYPARHKTLAEKITSTGALLSEYPPGTQPAAGNFPQRNRIISGMSAGVLVVEAAQKSGSLITARYALEQGRDVFAIPGSIHNPLVKGTHQLIKQGAKLVESIEDILEEIRPIVSLALTEVQSTINRSDLANKLDPEQQQLLEHMGYDEVSVDDVIASSGLTAGAVCSMLLLLELQGLVESRQGGKYCRCI